MSSEEQPKRSTEPVGQQLRRAREQLGLSLSAIADQQHLRASVIEAIEDGDFGKVDTELFLKGYVRAYARHVQLDADAIIADLEAELEPLRKERERQHDDDPLVDIERRKRRKRRVARAIIVILILAAIAFGVSVYLADGSRRLPGFSADKGSETSENVPDAVAESPEPQIQNTQQPEVPETDTSDASPTVSDSEDVPESGNSEVTIQPLDVETASSEPPQSASLDPVEVMEPVNPETGATEPEPVPEAEPALATEPAPAVNEEVASDNGRLRMSFSDDCWVQVTDAQGNRLASTLRTSGDVLEVSGDAPLSIVVGAMSAVESLEFQGEPVDLNNIRTVNNRAEFTL